MGDFSDQGGRGPAALSTDDLAAGYRPERGADGDTLDILAAPPGLPHRQADPGTSGRPIAAGQAVGFPQQAGLFRVAGSTVDPISGNVGLMIDPNPNGPTGFVRVRPGTPRNRRGPFGWDDLDVALGWGWEYREEE